MVKGNLKQSVAPLSNHKTKVMGIINATPDSFSNDGLFLNIDKALECACRMINDGADIIDVGGESTRPGSQPVSEAEELKRVVPFIKELAKITDKPISIDTQKAIVAEKSIEAGAQIINDVSALTGDKETAKVASLNKTQVVLMHMKGNPANMQNSAVYCDVVAEVKSFLKQRIAWAVDNGIDEEKIIVDPGIGFAKTVKHNLVILNRLEEFCELGRPILVGASRKSFIGKILDKLPHDRLFGSLATAAVSIAGGADIIRTHDVKPTVETARMCDAIKNSLH